MFRTNIKNLNKMLSYDFHNQSLKVINVQKKSPVYHTEVVCLSILNKVWLVQIEAIAREDNHVHKQKDDLCRKM